MPANIKILIQGYVREEGDEEFASSTAVLIQTGGKNIIVDPGMNRKLLIDSLAKENLSADNINFVILTHHHPDHSLLAGIFEKAQILDNDFIYSWDGKIAEREDWAPADNIKIIKTPGHSDEHCSILIDTKDSEKTAIAGDVFWRADEEEQKTDKESLLTRKDPYAKDEAALIKSRKLLLELANHIIPGHGKMFEGNCSLSLRGMKG